MAASATSIPPSKGAYSASVRWDRSHRRLGNRFKSEARVAALGRVLVATSVSFPDANRASLWPRRRVASGSLEGQLGVESTLSRPTASGPANFKDCFAAMTSASRRSCADQTPKLDA